MQGSSTFNERSGESVLALVARQWSAAAAKWNPEALAALYTNDALFFGGRTSHSVGRREVLVYFESYTGMLAGAELSMRDQHVIAIEPRSFLAQGFADIGFTLLDGRRTSGVFRTTWLLRDAAEPRIQLHHFSPRPEVPPIPA